jgi:hypothetical protein
MDQGTHEIEVPEVAIDAVPRFRININKAHYNPSVQPVYGAFELLTVATTCKVRNEIRSATLCRQLLPLTRRR